MLPSKWNGIQWKTPHEYEIDFSRIISFRELVLATESTLVLQTNEIQLKLRKSDCMKSILVERYVTEMDHWIQKDGRNAASHGRIHGQYVTGRSLLWVAKRFAGSTTKSGKRFQRIGYGSSLSLSFSVSFSLGLINDGPRNCFPIVRRSI